MYSYVKSHDGQHLCITHHKSRKEAEERNELECILLRELAENVAFHTVVCSNYDFNIMFPKYAGLFNHRYVHPIIQEKLDKVNNEKSNQM